MGVTFEDNKASENAIVHRLHTTQLQTIRVRAEFLKTLFPSSGPDNIKNI